jgi:hypothetical protein
LGYASAFVIVNLDLMIAAAKRHIGAQRARAAILKAIQHQHIVDIQTHAVVDAKDKAVGAAIKIEPALPAARPVVKRNAAGRRAGRPVEIEHWFVAGHAGLPG